MVGCGRRCDEEAESMMMDEESTEERVNVQDFFSSQCITLYFTDGQLKYYDSAISSD